MVCIAIETMPVAITRKAWLGLTARTASRTVPGPMSGRAAGLVFGLTQKLVAPR